MEIQRETKRTSFSDLLGHHPTHLGLGLCPECWVKLWARTSEKPENERLTPGTKGMFRIPLQPLAAF